jgi:hypothetical protein
LIEKKSKSKKAQMNVTKKEEEKIDDEVYEIEEIKSACKEIDQFLWKAEVDLENVEDIMLR